MGVVQAATTSHAHAESYVCSNAPVRYVLCYYLPQVYVGQLSGEKLRKFTAAPSLLSTSNVLVPRTQWETTTSKQKTGKPQFSDELPANKPDKPQVSDELPANKPHNSQVSDKLPANKPDNPLVSNELPANKPHNSQVSDELPANKPHNPQVSDELPADKADNAQVSDELPANKPHNPQVSDELPANKLEASATTTTSTHGKSRPNYQVCRCQYCVLIRTRKVYSLAFTRRTVVLAKNNCNFVVKHYT